jgi:Cytochrome P460
MGMKTSGMNRLITLSSLACLGLLGGLSATLLRSQAVPTALASDPSAPRYNGNGELLFPSKYREWTYLSSGIDMNYSPQNASADKPSHSTFDNVFVGPGAYKSFLDSGTWPDKTVLVLELRGAQNKGSINQSGYYQGSALKGIEVHVKDEARFPGKWAFFGFDNDVSGKLIPHSAACYSCHEAHGAVDTTFVQFYPTLLGIAEKKGTFSPAYLKELHTATPAQ